MRINKARWTLSVLCATLAPACNSEVSDHVPLEALPTARWTDAHDPLMGLVLPEARQVILFDPAEAAVSLLADFEESQFVFPSSTVQEGDRMVVLDRPGAAVGVVGLRTGEIGRIVSLGKPLHAQPGKFTEARLLGREIIAGEGRLFVTADKGANPVGVLYELDPVNLSVRREIEIAPGAYDAAWDRRGRIWTTNWDSGRHVDSPSMTIVDVSGWTATVVEVPGIPNAVALGPRGSMYVTLYDKKAVLELAPDGDILSRMKGLPRGPWGIAIRSDGIGVVASEIDDAVSFINFRSHEILHTVDVSEHCQVSREVAIVEQQVAVTCVTPPKLLLFDVETRGFTSSVRLAPGGAFVEEPRGLTVVQPAA